MVFSKKARSDMNIDELRKVIYSGAELCFSAKGRNLLLYGWEQCDGFVLTLECDGEPDWQSAPMSKKNCEKEFLRYFSDVLI